MDVTGIVRNDAITIARNKKDESVYAFTVTIKKKYFSSKEQAKNFVMEIAKVPQTVTNQMLEKLDYTRALISYAQYDQTYDDKIADLENQCSVINDIFTELLEKYGDRYLDETYDNERISSLQKKAQKIIDNLNSTIITEVEGDKHIEVTLNNQKLSTSHKGITIKRTGNINNYSVMTSGDPSLTSVEVITGLEVDDAGHLTGITTTTFTWTIK